MKRIVSYLLLMALLLSALLPINTALASNTTLAEYIGTIRITNNSTSSATSVFAVFNLTTQDLIDGDFCFQNVTNTSMQTNGGGDTEYMPAPGATTTWCVYVPSIIAMGTLDYRLYIGGDQDMDGEIRHFSGPITGLNTLDAASLEPDTGLETLANNWTIEQSGFANTTVGSGMNLADKDEAFISYISANTDITSGIWGTTTDFQFYNAGDDNNSDIRAFDTAQTFTPAQRHYIASVRLMLQNPGAAATGTIDIALKATAAGAPSGADLATGTISAATIGNVAAFHQIDFTTPYPLGANTQYAIVASDSVGDPLTNIVNWRSDASAPTYAGGQFFWASPGTPRAWDGMFEEWGYVFVTATGITSADYAVRTDLGVPDFAPGNALNFDGTGTSEVDCGAIYNAQAKLWISLWFRPDATTGAVQYLASKRIDGTHLLRLFTQNAELKFTLRDGVTKFDISIPEAGGFLGGQWYHVIASISSANGVRLILDNGTPTTDADTTAAPNGGDFEIGNENNTPTGFVGEIAFVVVGTDDLTVDEELALFQGSVPGDETDLWYLDEGNGTAITSYGSSANPGTAGAGTSWEVSTAMRNFIIYIDGTAEDGHHVIDVPSNANDWDFLQVDSMPFLEFQEITVDGVLRQRIVWENNAATFTDGSGNGNDATPTFRTASSHPLVTAFLFAFTPVSPAVASNVSILAPEDMIGPVVEPSNLFNETVDTGVPGVPFVEDVMASSGVPSIMFWVPLVMLVLCIVGLVVGKFSLLAQLIIMSIIIFAAQPLGVPAWIGIIFLLDGLAFVLASKQFGW